MTVYRRPAFVQTAPLYLNRTLTQETKGCSVAAADVSKDKQTAKQINLMVGWLAQLAERRSLAGELTLFYPRPVADG